MTQDTLESNALYEKQKHFENIYGQIRGYACLASLITNCKASGKLLDLIINDQVFAIGMSILSSDSCSIDKKQTPERENNNQPWHRCNAQYVCMIKLMH